MSRLPAPRPTRSAPGGHGSRSPTPAVLGQGSWPRRCLRLGWRGREQAPAGGHNRTRGPCGQELGLRRDCGGLGRLQVWAGPAAGAGLHPRLEPKRRWAGWEERRRGHVMEARRPPRGRRGVRSGPGDAGGRPSRGVVASLCPQQGGGHAPGMSWGPRRPRPSMLQDWQRAGAAGPASPRPTGQVSRQCLRTLTPTSPSCHGTVTPQRSAFSTFDTSLRAKRFLLIELGFDEC